MRGREDNEDRSGHIDVNISPPLPQGDRKGAPLLYTKASSKPTERVKTIYDHQ
jgi:hypothetical protein